MIDLGKKPLLGIGINAIDYEAAVAKIVSSAKRGERLTVTALAVHGVMTGVGDAEHRYRLNHLDMVVPDGQPVRWALNRLHGAGLTDRVYGPNLMLKTCQAAAEEGIPIYLFGATEAMVRELGEKLVGKFPALRIVGMEPSQFRRLDVADQQILAERIRRSGAQIAFVGIGCPRQEVWAYEMGDLLGMPILAVGAAFAFHAGHLSQAPAWMQRWGLEWLFRFTREPRRLWYRYLVLNPAYVSLLAMQWMGIKRIDPDSGTVPRNPQCYG